MKGNIRIYLYTIYVYLRCTQNHKQPTPIAIIITYMVNLLIQTLFDQYKPIIIIIICFLHLAVK